MDSEYKEIDEISPAIQNNSLTMNNLYTNYFHSTKAELIPTHVSNSGNQVTFYGTLGERWNNVFKQIFPHTGLAKGLNDTFKIWLNDNGLKIVYFVNNDDMAPTSIGNWDKHNELFFPTLNGIRYCNPRENISTFYWAYGGDTGGVLCRNSKYPWSSRMSDDSNAYRGIVNNSVWRGYFLNGIGGVVLSQDI